MPALKRKASRALEREDASSKKTDDKDYIADDEEADDRDHIADDAERQKALKTMGFDDNFMEKQSGTPGDWVDKLLSIFSTTPELRQNISDFQLERKQRIANGEFRQAVVESKEHSWVSRDRKMDELWDALVKEVLEVMGNDFPVHHMVKPSGPREAICHFMWHYPTFATTRKDCGMTMDTSNPSLRVQGLKIGEPKGVRTSDLIPMRHEVRKPDVS